MDYVTIKWRWWYPEGCIQTNSLEERKIYPIGGLEVVDDHENPVPLFMADES